MNSPQTGTSVRASSQVQDGSFPCMHIVLSQHVYIRGVVSNVNKTLLTVIYNHRLILVVTIVINVSNTLATYSLATSYACTSCGVRPA
jgi:hypothetical protein